MLLLSGVGFDRSALRPRKHMHGPLSEDHCCMHASCVYLCIDVWCWSVVQWPTHVSYLAYLLILLNMLVWTEDHWQYLLWIGQTRIFYSLTIFHSMNLWWANVRGAHTTVWLALSHQLLLFCTNACCQFFSTSIHLKICRWDSVLFWNIWLLHFLWNYCHVFNRKSTSGQYFACMKAIFSHHHF